MYTVEQYESLRRKIDDMVLEFNYLNGEVSKLRTELKNSIGTFERRLLAREADTTAIARTVCGLEAARLAKLARSSIRRRKPAKKVARRKK